MLAVNLDQGRAELPQQTGRRGLIVDEGAAAAVGLDETANDERFARLAGKTVLVEQGPGGMAVGDFEGDGDDRLRLSVADEAAVGAVDDSFVLSLPKAPPRHPDPCCDEQKKCQSNPLRGELL